MPKISGMALQVKAAVPKPNDLSVIPNIHIAEIRPTLSSHSLTSTHAPTYIHITPKEKIACQTQCSFPRSVFIFSPKHKNATKQWI